MVILIKISRYINPFVHLAQIVKENQLRGTPEKRNKENLPPIERSIPMEHKIIIDSLDTATVTCPRCQRKKTLLLTQYRIDKPVTRIRYRCSCKETFCAVLERRGRGAREMRLAGTCTSRGEKKWSGRMTVKRLNARGVTLMLSTRQKVMTGNRLDLEFVLDDAKQSIVKKQVVVTAMDGPYVSAVFLSQEHFDNLGPYLFFNKLLG